MMVGSHNNGTIQFMQMTFIQVVRASSILYVK